MSQADQWYYGTPASEQKGPFTRDQVSALIQQGVVNTATLVWSAGMQAWQPLSQTSLADLIASSASVPPVMPSQSSFMPNVAPAQGAEPKGFGEAIRTCFSKYVTFAGRASRSEYWYFFLFIVILTIVTAILDSVLFLDGGIAPLSTITTFGIFLPQLSAAVRRLHDTDFSGWWILMAFIPIVGYIVLIVLLCQAGTPNRNRFG